MKKIDRILLVDDNEASNFLASSILKDMDFADTIDVAKNGQEAILKIRRDIPDLLFLDMKMPVMDGIQFLENNDQISLRTQVVSLTTHLTPAEHVKLKGLGVQYFIDKPITRKKVEQLVKAIAV